MPLIAQHPQTGEAVQPEQLGNKFYKKQSLECPYCGGKLRYRNQATDDNGRKLRRAHFWHFDKASNNPSNGPGGCEAGGESVEHESAKQTVLNLLENKYRGSLFVEQQIGGRTADCGIDFSNTNRDKRGVVVEVQHRHRDKSYRSVTENYLKHGYAVHWVFVINDDWDLLFDAKDELEREQNDVDYWMGKINESEAEYELGDMLWFDKYTYYADEKTDFINGESNSVEIKIDLPWLSDLNTYLVVKSADIDQTKPELVADDLFRRVRPSKYIADAIFD